MEVFLAGLQTFLYTPRRHLPLIISFLYEYSADSHLAPLLSL